MATLCGLVVEDEPDLCEILSRMVVPLVVGCTEVVACESIADLRRVCLPEGALVVLVTDGRLPDGTCADVIEHVLAVFGPHRLGGHALLTSANSRSSWASVFSQAYLGGIELSYSQKPVSIEDLETWWKAVNRNFI